MRSSWGSGQERSPAGSGGDGREDGAVDVSAFPRCAAATDLRAACRGVVDDLHDRWPLPSAYLLVDGRLRCMASRGYFQVSDGFTTSTGVIGRVVSNGRDRGPAGRHGRAGVRRGAARPARRGRACRCGSSARSSARSTSSRASGCSPEAVADVERAAVVLGPPARGAGRACRPRRSPSGSRTSPSTSPARPPSREVRRRALRGAQELSGLRDRRARRAGRATAGRSPSASARWHQSSSGWDERVLDRLAGWVQAKTSSYFPPGEAVPPGYELPGR